VAIKVLSKQLFEWEDPESLPEIRSLMKIDHQNTLKLERVIKYNSEVSLVFEYCGMSLLRLIRRLRDKKSILSEGQIKRVIFQLIKGVEATHKKGFIHRDIKPENVLINKDFVVKLSDFGIAREIRARHPCTEYVSTRWYRSPEMLLHSSAYSTPVDMWAVGCVLAELCLMRPLFTGESEIDQLSQICSILGTPGFTEWPDAFRLAAQLGFTLPVFEKKQIKDVLPSWASFELVSLLSELLRFDPGRRLTAEQALNHPFFTELILEDDGLPTKEVAAALPPSQIANPSNKPAISGAGSHQQKAFRITKSGKKPKTNTFDQKEKTQAGENTITMFPQLGKSPQLGPIVSSIHGPSSMKVKLGISSNFGGLAHSIVTDGKLPSIRMGNSKVMPLGRSLDSQFTGSPNGDNKIQAPQPSQHKFGTLLTSLKTYSHKP
jgi:serine/threonine protein kinase